MYQEKPRESQAVDYFLSLKSKMESLIRVGDMARSRKRRTKPEVELAYAAAHELIKQGMSAKAACIQAGVLQSNYSRYAYEKGWKTTRQPIPDDIIQVCKKYRGEGKTWKEIGVLVSRDPQTLRKHLGDCTAERAMWIDSQTDKAIERLKLGESIQSVADSMGVSYSLLANRLKDRGFNRKAYLTAAKEATR